MFFLSCREVEGRGKGRERAIELADVVSYIQYALYQLEY